MFAHRQKITDGSRKSLFFNWQLHLLLLLPVAYLLLFKYYPMIVSHIAFKNYTMRGGIFGGSWVGLKHFQRFLTSYEFSYTMKNTLMINLYLLIAGFPFPIVLALALNYCRARRLKKVVQIATYAPYFISTVVLVGIINQLFALRTGIVNNVLDSFFHVQLDFLGDPSKFYSLFVWSEIWKITGYNSIIYLAALSTVDTEQHEAATIDGATLFQRVRYIDLAAIRPTMAMLFTLQTGRILNVGFEKALLMQNSSNIFVSEVVSTYVYNIGIASPSVNYSYPTAVGIFSSVINLAMILIVNGCVKALGEEGMF